MSVSGQSDNRKQDFLDAALELFYEKGYDRTTINDIINSLGLSKGAFYHYFKSKEEILDAIAEQHSQTMYNMAQEIASDDRLNALEKINGIILITQRYKSVNKSRYMKIVKVVDRDGNTKLRRQIHESIVKLNLPLFQRIIEQGIEEGVFSTPSSIELANLLMYILTIFNGLIAKISFQDDNLNSIEEMKIKISFYENILERILGTKEGAINLSKLYE